MANRGAWQDGQAAVSWLTGTHVGTSWVAKQGSKYFRKAHKNVFNLKELISVQEIRTIRYKFFFDFNLRMPDFLTFFKHLYLLGNPK